MYLDGIRRWPSSPSEYRVLLGLQVAALASIVGAALLLPPSAIGFNTCLSRLIFHADCPGCGLTRSMIAFAHGRLGNSLAFHPAGHLLFSYMVLLLAKRASALFGGRQPLGAIGGASFGTIFLSLTMAGWVIKVLFM